MTDFDTLIERLGLTVLDGHKYIGPLGKGGQGQVCRYAHAQDGREVAVKLLIAPADPYAVERFTGEAKALLDLQKKNLGNTIVRGITEARQVPGLPVHYFVMERAPGEPLIARIERSRPPWDWRVAVETTWRVAMAISPAHVGGVVHRDLHPGNVMLDDANYQSPVRGREFVPCATVLDMGVHRYSLRFAEDGLSEPPPTFRPVGSVKYASPEALIDPESVTSASDVWALGTMLYVFLTGEIPFEGRTLRELADAKKTGVARIRCVAAGASPTEEKMLSDLLSLVFDPESGARPTASELGAILSDALHYNLADRLADPAFRELYLRKLGYVGFCLHCRKVVGRNGTQCEACGQQDEYQHWSLGGA